MCIADLSILRVENLKKRSFALLRMTFRHFFLCLFFLKRFLRLWVAILLFFLFFPLGIVFFNFSPLAGGLVKQLF